MRFWLAGSLLCLLPVVSWAQEKPCPVEAVQISMLKQARDAAERRAAELAVQIQQLVKEKQVLEKRASEGKKVEERE